MIKIYMPSIVDNQIKFISDGKDYSSQLSDVEKFQQESYKNGQIAWIVYIKND